MNRQVLKINDSYYYDVLLKTAEKILSDTPPEQCYSHSISPINYKKQLDLHHIELEVQNENLQSALSTYEEELHHHQELYHAMPFGFLKLDHFGFITEVNDPVTNLLGIKKRYLLGKLFSRYIDSEFQNVFKNHVQKALDTMRPQTLNTKVLKKHGAIFWCKIISKPVIDRLTHDKFLLIFLFDENINVDKVDDAKKSLKSLNFINQNSASIITHELNQPLSIIINYLYGCISRLESKTVNPNEIISALKKAVQQSHHACNIIAKIKNFTCKGKLSFESIDINKIIISAIELLHNEIIDFLVDINFKPSKFLPLVFVDKSLLVQAIINLCRNAVEAMRDAEISEPRITFHLNQVTVDLIEIAIMDNGPGIKEEEKHKVFNPHFSTKPYGLGLGLAISQSIIEVHKSKIIMEEALSGGACFKFTLSTISHS